MASICDETPHERSVIESVRRYTRTPRRRATSVSTPMSAKNPGTARAMGSTILPLVYRRAMRSWGVWCASAALAVATSARADTCPVPDGGDARLAAIDAKARIDFLHRNFDSQAHYARLWKWWWVGIGTATFASSVGQAIGWAAVGDEKTREANVVDNVIVSGFSAVTPIFAVLFALRVEKDAPAVDELLRQTN